MILDCICKYETMMLMNMIKFDKLTLSLPPLGLKSGSVPGSNFRSIDSNNI